MNNKGGNPEIPPATVSYGTGDPTVAKGTVSVGNMGSYKITANGYTANGLCALVLTPMLGGELPANANAQNAANGTWGPIAAKNLPSGQYLVFGSVTFTNANNLPTNVFSPGAVLNVP